MITKDELIIQFRAKNKELIDKLEAIKVSFPVLKDYIKVGDKIGIKSSIEVIEEILEGKNGR